MAEHTTNVTKYCKKEHDVMQVDGTYTCIRCGIVEDSLLMEPMVSSKYATTNYSAILKDRIDEFCERGNIDTQTAWCTYRLFNNVSKQKRRFHKLPLIATCLYISCKQNDVARTIKEISAITGCDIKKIGKYEMMVSHIYHPVTPSMYVERFCSKMDLEFGKVKMIQKQVNLHQDSMRNCNPAATACAFIYLYLNQEVCLGNLEDISGVPKSSIKRIAQKLNKLL